MSKPYDSVLTAEFLVAKAKERGANLNITQVQKLLYIAYGIFLARHDKAFIKEQPKAWPYGPVFPRTQKRVDVTSEVESTVEKFTPLRQDAEVINVINEVVDKGSNIPAAQLTAWSHQVGSPWHKTTLQDGFKWNQTIPDEYIKSYFKKFEL